MHQLKQVITQLWQHKNSTIATILIMGTIVYLMNIVIGGYLVIQQSEKNARQNIEISLLIQEHTDDEDIKKFENELKKIDSVKTVKLITEKRGTFSLNDPRKASLYITTHSNENQARVINFLKQSKFQNDIQAIESDKKARILNDIGKFIKTTRVWMILIVIFSSFLVITQTLQLTNIKNLLSRTLAGSLYGAGGAIIGSILILLTPIWPYIAVTTLLSIFIAEIILGILIGASCAIIGHKE